MPKVAIVIVAYNQLLYSKLTISSVINHTSVPYTIFFVNNGSQDSTDQFATEMVNQYKDTFVYIKSDSNLGFAKGNNLALREIQKDPSYTHILLLNNDTIVPKHYMENMLKVFYNVDQNIGLVGPVTNYAGTRQCIDKVRVQPETFEAFSSQWEIDPSHHNICYRTGMLIGFCLMIKREVFDKVGLLDERFLNAFEDNDYVLRCSQLGYSSYVALDCFVYHFGSKTLSDKSVVQNSEDLFYDNKKKFYDKWAEINKIGEHKKIVGMLRVKNGGDILRETLSAHSELCDEIVVFDDHSTDQTEQICKSFPKVVDYYKSEYTEFNEARDRNHVLKMAQQRNPDWIFCIDHDEVPEQTLIRDIQKIVNSPNPEAKLYCFQICHIWNSGDMQDNTHFRVDGLWGTFYQGRLFKCEPNQVIRNNEDDGLHVGSHPNIPAENRQTITYRIKHYGNADPVIRLKKYMWYTRTDKVKDVKAILGAYEPWYTELYGRIEADKPENAGKKLGPYKLKDSDYYRHIINENSLVLTEWKENITLSASIIVRTSDYDHLDKCLTSINNICDEIIIVQTDGDEFRCKRFEDSIESKLKWYYHKWQDSFSEARNFALSKCTSDWILRIDADEVLQEPAQIHLKRIMSNDEAEVIMFPITNYLLPDAANGQRKWTMSKTNRAFKNIQGIQYIGRVHEEITDSISELGKTRPMRIFDAFPVNLLHYGYIQDKCRLWDKYDYYNKLLHMDIQETPKRPEPYFNLAVDYYHRDDFDKAEMYYRKTLELNPNQWRSTHDLGIIIYKRAMKKVENELIESIKYLKQAKELIVKTSDTSYERQLTNNMKKMEQILEDIKPKDRSQRHIKE